MSLPASQQRALDAIENALARREPRLTSMFAMFTRLATGEALPRREALDLVPWWSRRRWPSHGRHRGPLGRARAAVLLALTAVLAVSAVLLSVSQSSAGCGVPLAGRGPLTMHVRTHSCPAVPQARVIGEGHGR
jgi:hypothetical protein